MNQRDALALIWKAGVAQAGGHNCVQQALQSHKISKPDGIIAIGKAATPMLEAALSHAGYDTKSLLVTKYGHVICRYQTNQPRLEEYQEDGTLRIIEAAHPVPDKNSLVAGLALRSFVDEMPDGSHLLVLVSGGASSLAEILPETMSLKELQHLNQKLLQQGADIAAMNSRRIEQSCIKGGKLLAKFKGERITVLAISDVAGDEINIIGSGIGATSKSPAQVLGQTYIVASNKTAREACAKKAAMLGFDIAHNDECAYGEVETVAQRIFDKVKKFGAGLYIFGGETTVVLPESPGRGGRNQHLALILAKLFGGFEGVEFLVAGSDGSDGSTQAAGGFGDAKSFLKIPGGAQALAKADAGSFLQASGDLFSTGPTGTNVMDLILVIKSETSA